MIFSGRRSRLARRRNCPVNGSRDNFQKSQKDGLAVTLTSRLRVQSLQLAARSSSSGKVPSVFSEELKPSEKSRSKVAPRPKFSLSAAVAAALILEGDVAARSEIKTCFLGEFFDLATPTFSCEKNWWGALSM